jgi:hypothetical protein
MLEKLKSLILNDQLFYSFLVLLVGVASFTLGRASMAPGEQITPQIQTLSTESPSTAVNPVKDTSGASFKNSVPESETAVGLSLVASKSGTKYHLSTCPGAKQIKSENKITFNSVKEAEAAGYKPAANCPGLQ